MDKATTFYETLCACPDLDLRDKRGKHLNLCLMLLEFCLAVLSGRDGNQSSIYRHMRAHHEAVVQLLGLPKGKASSFVSRAHFPRLLSKVNAKVFCHLLQQSYGVQLSGQQKEWFAVDGKELRGSIKRGFKRGEALVRIVRHSDKAVVAESFHNGRKDSEVPAVRQLLSQEQLLGQQISIDALHCKPDTLIPINKAGGTYLVGLKQNQPEMLSEMHFEHANKQPLFRREDQAEKGHGRIEKRTYECYCIEQAYIAKRWEEADLRSLVVVEREREVVLTANKSFETAYYLTNKHIKTNQQAAEIFDAIRGHWQVESSNNERDCILSEDKMRCTCSAASRTAAACRTLAIKLLNELRLLTGQQNRAAIMDEFKDNFKDSIDHLRDLNFL